MRRIILLLTVILAVACQKNDDIQQDIEPQNTVETVEITDYMSAFNNLNLPVNPQPSSSKGDNWLDIAWFAVNGQSYVYVRSNEYTGAETCYAFLEETLASYTLQSNSSLLLEQGQTSTTLDIEAGLYDDVFATNYNTLYDTTTAGVITGPSATAVSSLGLDGDCALSELINGAVLDSGVPTLDDHNNYWDVHSYGYSSSQINLEQVGDSSEITITGIKVPAGKKIKYILVATHSSWYSNYLYKSNYEGKLQEIFTVDDGRKFAILEVSERLNQKFIVELIETNYSGGWYNQYTYFQVIYSDVDTDSDGVIDFEDIFPEDASEVLDDDFDGIGNNSDLLPKIKNIGWTGWIYSEGDNTNVSGSNNAKDWNIEELGEVVDYFGSKVYIQGTHGVVGETINVAVNTRGDIVNGTIAHTTHITYGDVTTIVDEDGKFDVATTGTAYQLTEEE